MTCKRTGKQGYICQISTRGFASRPQGPKLEVRRALSGGWVLGEGQQAPSPPARRSGGA